jgi:hypothetical protein
MVASSRRVVSSRQSGVWNRDAVAFRGLFTSRALLPRSIARRLAEMDLPFVGPFPQCDRATIVPAPEAGGRRQAPGETAMSRAGA